MTEHAARAEMIRHFAHDLKNPLTAVRVLLDVLVEDAGPELQDDLADAAKAVELCAAMADGLADFARVEADADPTYEFEVVDLGALVTTVVQRIADRATVVPIGTVVARADPSAAARALNAVLLNSIRMVDPEDLAIRIEPGAEVIVLHRGATLSPRDAHDLLALYGGSALRDRRVKASALGLAYARLTMESLGGTLTVEVGDDGVVVRLQFIGPA